MTAGLAGPAPDAEQASAASGTAAAGEQSPPAAAPEHPGSSSPGDGAGSAPAPELPEPATGGSAEEPTVTTPAGPSDAAGDITSPAAPDTRGCEKCGAPIGEAEAGAGYRRCGDCDEEGDHVDDGNGCRGCRILAETDQAYVSLSVGETEFGLAFECGECDSLVAHLAIGASVPSILAAAREHHRSCS